MDGQTQLKHKLPTISLAKKTRQAKATQSHFTESNDRLTTKKT